ncbi:transglycosylase SLT domain-containing protein [Elioraea sp.]|uniref:transglycosylase SLT domain-containing protein n=1 Tax=Elioraea sp. TaxID=2185103 RepID=UPI0025C5366A|nr:transporter substrate-binding domain-containing protein [Elioraea sp.]
MAIALPAAAQRGAIDDSADVPPASGEEILATVNEAWTGDLGGIRERRLLRVITTYNRTNFFIEHGQGRGLEFEALTRFGAWFADRRTPDAARGGPAVPIRVVFVPVPREELIPALLAGRGDVIAAGLTVTDARATRVLFTDPYIRRVDEVLVRHKDAPELAAIEDLSGRTLLLTRGTSYVANARALSDRLVAAGRAPIRIVEAPAHLETEDVLELIGAGAAQYTIVDDHLAEVWDKLLPNLVVQHGVHLVSGGTIAWAVHPGAKALQAALDAFLGPLLADRATAMTIYRRYFENVTFIRNPWGPTERDRIRVLAPHFQSASERVGFEWLLMAAQGFQESRLDPTAQSHVGARGVMQLMPATAREVGVRNIDDAEDNIHGGVRYMERLRETYFNDPAIPPEVQIQFALAGYNAGPNRINRLRQEAAKQGLDPNQWFGHVERVVQQRVGSEPVRYVANIFAVYATYAMANDLLADRAEELKAFREAIGEQPAAAPSTPR